MNDKFLVPSLLAFDKTKWSYYFKIFEKNNINYIHFDVMDYEYVKNTAFDYNEYLQIINDNNSLLCHVHLMVMDPLNGINKYFHSKTDAICFHFDVYDDENKVIECLNLIKQQNIKAGIAINPNYRIQDYKQYLPYCNFLTIMGVYPGKGGQPFENDCLINLQQIKQWSLQNNQSFLIEIDGGMNFDTIPLVVENGQFIVTGSFLEKNISKILEINQWFHKLF